MLIINDFAVKSKLELYSSEWLRSKKESITNGDNCFQNALNDSLDYQRIKKDSQVIPKIKPYISQYNWNDIEFEYQNFLWQPEQQQINKTDTLMPLMKYIQ